MNNRRSQQAETIAVVGGLLQLLVGALLLILSLHTSEKIWFRIFAIQNGVGSGFFLMAWMHLRLRRLAATEKIDRDEVEKSRQARGLASLFSDDDIPPAERNLRHFQKYIVPIASVILGIALFVPAFFLIISLPKFPGAVFDDLPLAVNAVLGILPLLAAFLLFLVGTYGTGLIKFADWRPLRAGVGYALISALWLAIFGAVVLLGFKISFYPLRGCGLLCALWAALQGTEILLSTLFDHYRPRMPGVETRAPYDSRLAGLLAEPEGVFQTLSQTLDYQFGFRVSDTWFFRFLERSLVPLILLMLVILYLMSSVVIVAPGHAAVIERFGAPRGLENFNAAAVDWDNFAVEHPPLKNGLHFKYPYPFERALIVAQDSPMSLEFGHSEAVKGAKKETVDDDGHGHGHEATRVEDSTGEENIVANWEVVHSVDELLYLMPLPKREQGTAQKSAMSGPDVMLLSGEFSVQYRVDNDADVYRYLYSYRDSREMLRTLIDRELTACLAGEDFWQILSSQADSQIREKLFNRVVAAVERENLGIKLTSLIIKNLHPPAGETGMAFLAVTSSLQKRETEINGGKIEAIKILGMAPAEAEEVLNAADAYKHRRLVLAEADRYWFGKQLQADAAAAGIFRMEKQMRMLENALGDARKILLPSNATMIMDDSKSADPDSVNSIIARQINKSIDANTRTSGSE